MVKEEERIFQGIVFCPGDPELVAPVSYTHLTLPTKLEV